ncbi:MAG: class I SAM-dependent methyltransferase [Chitinophagaceae bacterium]|nr:class I SAM-dependent methyltransferase [Chitinophagaceae bacterium]
MDNEKEIIASWQVNAGNWIDVLERKGIESRQVATNRAIVEEICLFNPKTVLDIGCGEGWLAGELTNHGIRITAIDVVPELVERAKSKIEGTFIVSSYEDLASGRTVLNDKFDAIVINFALIGKESTDQLLAALPRYLNHNGALFIQTLHPHVKKGVNDYITGWKTGSWDGLGGEFTQPYQWFFRTLEDWLDLLRSSGFERIVFRELLHPKTRQLLSVIFKCRTRIV